MKEKFFIFQISWLGMYPTWETFIGQAVLFILFVFALFYICLTLRVRLHKKVSMNFSLDIEKRSAYQNRCLSI